jgi:hypothetical protein
VPTPMRLARRAAARGSRRRDGGRSASARMRACTPVVALRLLLRVVNDLKGPVRRLPTRP